jgi:type II secretory pathway component PulM
MAASIDGLRERWERMNPREQRLLALLGAALIIGIIGTLVGSLQSGMADIEKKNAESRKALRSLAVHRNAKALSDDTGPKVEIPDKAVALDSYLEGIISELGLTSPTYPALKENKVGQFIELSFEVKVKALDLASLSELLQRIETGSKLVVIKELNIDPVFKSQEKLDLTMTVATYQTVNKKKEEKSESSEGEDS